MRPRAEVTFGPRLIQVALSVYRGDRYIVCGVLQLEPAEWKPIAAALAAYDVQIIHEPTKTIPVDSAAPTH